MFGMVRCMTHSRGADARELADRTNQAVQIQHVLEKHPEWDGESKRLRTTKNHLNSRS